MVNQSFHAWIAGAACYRAVPIARIVPKGKSVGKPRDAGPRFTDVDFSSLLANNSITELDVDSIVLNPLHILRASAVKENGHRSRSHW
jgi:hypothetical protein